jgi:hypothetical protein
VKPGASMYAEVDCAEVPNYGVALYVTGICNTAGRLAASGTYLTDRYGARGGASTRPRGVSAGPVSVTPPGAATDGEARVEIDVAAGTRYRARRHLVSILLLDAATGVPVAINYAKETRMETEPDGNVAGARVRIPAGTEMPANLEAVVMADAFPLSGPAPVGAE